MHTSRPRRAVPRSPSSARSQSARNEKFKVIVEGNVDERQIRAYDLEKDPREQLPWVPNLGDPLVQAALAIQAPIPGIQAELDTDKLKALGYMQ